MNVNEAKEAKIMHNCGINYLPLVDLAEASDELDAFNERELAAQTVELDAKPVDSASDTDDDRGRLIYVENEPLVWDPSIVADDKPFDPVDVNLPWANEDFLPPSFMAPWLVCHPKTGAVNKFYPNIFVNSCLLSEEYPEIIFGLVGDSDIQIYDAEKGTYVNGVDHVEFLTRLACPTLASTSTVKEVLASLKSEMRRRPNEFSITPNPWMISFHNGTLDLEAYYNAWQENPDANPEEFLLPPSPEHKAVIYVPWDLHWSQSDSINKGALDYVNGFISRIASWSIEKTQQLKELSASILWGTNSTQSQICFLVSDGSSGKSSIISLLTNMMGGVAKYHNICKNAVSNVSIGGLSKRFQSYKLVGSSVNFDGDASSGIISADAFSLLKSISSSEQLFVEDKGRSGFSAAMRCKFIAASNTLPKLSNADTSGYALERRLLIIKFNECFKKGTPGYDPLLNQRLEMRPVIEAFISSIIPYLCSYISNQFAVTVTGESSASYQELVLQNDSVSAFLEEYEELNNAAAWADLLHQDVLKKVIFDFVGGREVYLIWPYQLYKEAFCKQSNRSPVTEHRFTKEILKRFPGLVRDDRTLKFSSVDGKQHFYKKIFRLESGN